MGSKNIPLRLSTPASCFSARRRGSPLSQCDSIDHSAIILTALNKFKIPTNSDHMRLSWHLKLVCFEVAKLEPLVRSAIGVQLSRCTALWAPGPMSGNNGIIGMDRALENLERNVISVPTQASNIIKYHQISSNIIKHNEVISRHFRILTYSDIGYDRLGWAVAQRLLLPAKDLDSRAWHRQFAIENGRRNSWFMLIYPLKLGWFSTMMLVYQRVIVDEYWMNIDWWIL